MVARSFLARAPASTIWFVMAWNVPEFVGRGLGGPSGSKLEVPTSQRRVAERLDASGQAARTITTKVRYPDFSIRSRSRSLSEPTDQAERIAEVACQLLDRALKDRPGALRLVGVGASNLVNERQLPLVSSP